MQGDRPRVGHVAQRLHVVHDEVVDLALGVLRVDALRANPGGGELRGVFLEEGLAGDPVGIAREHERAIPEIGEEQRGDALVVRHQVAFGVAVGGPEHLLEIGQLDFFRRDHRGYPLTLPSPPKRGRGEGKKRAAPR